jgi:hypothetical protein
LGQEFPFSKQERFLEFSFSMTPTTLITLLVLLTPVLGSNNVCICFCCPPGAKACETNHNDTFPVESCGVCTSSSCVDKIIGCSPEDMTIIAQCVGIHNLNVVLNSTHTDKANSWYLLNVITLMLTILLLFIFAVLKTTGQLEKIKMWGESKFRIIRVIFSV